MTSLSLDCNEIGDAGCIVLCENLPRSVQDFSLDGNKIGTIGCEAVLKLLQSEENHLGIVEVNDNPGFDRIADRFDNAKREKKAFLEEVVKERKAEVIREVAR